MFRYMCIYKYIVYVQARSCSRIEILYKLYNNYIYLYNIQVYIIYVNLYNIFPLPL